MLISLQLATVHICMLYASSEKSIIFFRRGWCKCPSAKFSLYSDNGLHPFGSKSNIYGTLTTVLIHRDPIANFLAILLFCHMKKKTRVGDQMIIHWKNGIVDMPLIPRNWEPTSWKCQSKVVVCGTHIGINKLLTNLHLVPHICISESGQHWFR